MAWIVDLRDRPDRFRSTRTSRWIFTEGGGAQQRLKSHEQLNPFCWLSSFMFLATMPRKSYAMRFQEQGVKNGSDMEAMPGAPPTYSLAVFGPELRGVAS